mgnify:CR=1 FL=1
MKALIIDDHPIFSDGLRLLLRTLGIAQDIETCTDSTQALHLLQHQAFDLILMDLHMPVLDGYAATAKIRQWQTQQHQS